MAFRAARRVLALGATSKAWRANVAAWTLRHSGRLTSEQRVHLQQLHRTLLTSVFGCAQYFRRNAGHPMPFEPVDGHALRLAECEIGGVYDERAIDRTTRLLALHSGRAVAEVTAAEEEAAAERAKTDPVLQLHKTKRGSKAH